MSQWTHVAGIIRFDGLFLGEELFPQPDLGKTCHYDSQQEDWDLCNVPCGSEGSLQHSLHTNPDEASMARWVASFWGDLRDYSNEREIVDYFNRMVKERMIRQGCFTVDVEFTSNNTYCYNDETKQFELKQNQQQKGNT